MLISSPLDAVILFACWQFLTMKTADGCFFVPTVHVSLKRLTEIDLVEPNVMVNH